MEIAEGYFEPHSAFHDFLAVMVQSCALWVFGGTLDMVGLFSYFVEGEIGRCSGLTDSYCLLITSFTVKTSQDVRNLCLLLFCFKFCFDAPQNYKQGTTLGLF